MGTRPELIVDRKKDQKVFINRKFFDTDFSNKDLTHADFRGSTAVNCNFDHSDLSYATFESANCYGSSFRQSKCYHTNFKDAVLANVIMDPRDMFGMTVSISCDTFDKIQLGTIWLAGWFYLPMLGDVKPEDKEKMRAFLENLIGEERVKSLERIFANRQI